MTYISGSLASVNPAADLYAQMAPALVSAGFTLVDTVVIGTRTHKVWKSAAANNSQNLDWYLDVAYTTTGVGSVWLNAFEYYDPTTHLGYRGLIYDAGTTIEQTYFSRHGASGFTLESSQWAGVINQNITQLETNSNSFGYWLSITGDRVIGLTSMDSVSIIYCGFFDPNPYWSARIGTLLFPLIGGTLDSQGVSLSNVVGTRLPCITSSNNGWRNIFAFRIAVSGGGGPHGFIETGEGTVLGGVYGGKINIQVDVSNQEPGTSSFYIGTLKDCAVFGSAVVSRGDSITIDGFPWTLASNKSSRATAFKAI